jgi:diguanylate cyclase (GGDEF)-like protein
MALKRPRLLRRLTLLLAAGVTYALTLRKWWEARSELSRMEVLEKELRYRATHDPLTDLPTRNVFMNRLEGALARAQRSGRFPAVLFLDLDNFKAINDSHGHVVGDAALREVARRLRTSVRLGDTVSRIGGDEFVVLLEEVRDANEAARAVGRIGRRLQAPLVVDGRETTVHASIGMALGGPGTEAPEALVRRADFQMYRAKSRRRNA